MSLAFLRRLGAPLTLLCCSLWAGQAPVAPPGGGVDLSGLTAAQKKIATQTLHDLDCSCKCGMKVDVCRVADPSCSYSKGMAQVVVESVKAGKTESEAIASAKASRFGHTEGPKLLDDPVQIPVTGAPVTGGAKASVTLVEFSDFQCPYCATAVQQIAEAMKAYPSQVKLIFKQYPLETHPQAAYAAAASLAAHKQGKFWPMYEALFANRNDLSPAAIAGIAKNLGLNVAKFQADAASTEVKEQIIRDVQDGDQAGVQGTPTIFVNGQRYNGSLDLESFKPVLDAALRQGTPKAQTASLRH